VVCGPKKVGKSTFGRVLVNALLAQHPCVAYLDTGGQRGRTRAQLGCILAPARPAAVPRAAGTVHTCTGSQPGSLPLPCDLQSGACC
jgi:hypothetical protein